VTLSQVEAAQLLETAARASNELRLALLRRLVGELPAGLWPVYGSRILGLAQVPRGSVGRRELIELIAGLPIRQKYSVLIELAQDSSDPDDPTVMRALLASLRRDGLSFPPELWGVRGFRSAAVSGPPGPFDPSAYRRVDVTGPDRSAGPGFEEPGSEEPGFEEPGPDDRDDGEVPAGSAVGGPDAGEPVAGEPGGRDGGGVRERRGESGIDRGEHGAGASGAGASGPGGAAPGSGGGAHGAHGGETGFGGGRVGGERRYGTGRAPTGRHRGRGRAAARPPAFRPAGQAAAPPQPATGAPPPTVSAAQPELLDGADPVYPRLDVPDSAAPGVPFPVVVGLRPDLDLDLVGPGRLRLPEDTVAVRLRLVLAYDPYAFVPVPDPDTVEPVAANGEYLIVRTALDPFPSITLRFVALAGGDLAADRRIDVSFVRDGALIGFASRAVTVGSAPPAAGPGPDAGPGVDPGGNQGPDLRVDGAPGPGSQASGAGPRIPDPSHRVPGHDPVPGRDPGPGDGSGVGHDPLAGRPAASSASHSGAVAGADSGATDGAVGGVGSGAGWTPPGPRRPLGSPRQSGPRNAAVSSGALDLTSLLDADRPDLVIVIRRSAALSGHRLVFTALSPHERVNDLVQPRTEQIIGQHGTGVTPHELGAQARAKVATTLDQYDLYTWLLGMGRRIYRSMPAPIRAALRATTELGTSDRAATVLVLSDEPYVPWELAAHPGVWPGVASGPGGRSPFLGAHVAISRWLVTDEPPPPPRPPAVLDIHRTAVVTARYQGVLGADPLPHAEQEAQRLIEALHPAAIAVRPALDDILALINGDPAADLLHFALHGRFDPLGVNGGLILPPDPDRPLHPHAPVSLDENHIRSRQLKASAFVYLNACQIGAGDNRLLGDYGGMAAAFLEAGAGAVLAPLWNITDSTAAAVAEEVYRTCLGVRFSGDRPGSVGSAGSVGAVLPVAETLRRIRARYTEHAVQQEVPGVDATLVSFQLFGHPRLVLRAGE